jgi:saccharopine dehydrogenase-like NADP-dependent oxidoreductase
MNKSVLVLGAGLVSKPLINYFLSQGYINVTVASKDFLQRDYIDNHERGTTVDFDINDEEHLEELVKNHDITVSLLPYAFHIRVANLCLKYKKHMTTASYVSEEMKKLDEEAKAADIAIINEIGLDPGIDHMSAMKIIHEAQENGGTIESFYSNCGGLPFWDATTTPFMYKFSWSPLGVLLAAKNDAEFYKDREVVKIENKDLFKQTFKLDLGEFGLYEVYANRDSVKYIELYGLKNIKTLFRGTIRNLGWADFFDAVLKLDILNNTQSYNLEGKSYKWLVCNHFGIDVKEDVEQYIADKLGIHKLSQIINKFKFLGLFSDDLIKGKANTLFDVVLNIISEKLRYAPDEKDMILLQHDFIVDYGTRKEEVKSLLIAHGDDAENHIMSKTVGLPLAITTRLLLDGKISDRGVLLPLKKEIYEPVLDELADLGIAFIETRKDIN